MLFNSVQLQDWQSTFFWESVGDPNAGIYEIICTFQRHRQLKAVPLWQQLFCMWLFWTKSLVLHLIRVISCMSFSTKLIVLSKALLDIFPIFCNCVWTFSVLCMKLCHMNCQLYHFGVITFLDLSSAWCEFDNHMPSALHCAPIVTDVGGAVNNTGV